MEECEVKPSPKEAKMERGWNGVPKGGTRIGIKLMVDHAPTMTSTAVDHLVAYSSSSFAAARFGDLQLSQTGEAE